MKTAHEFLAAIDNPSLKGRDRAEALLWWSDTCSVSAAKGMTVSEICKVIEMTGHPAQNQTRMKDQMLAEKKVFSRVPRSNAWRLHPSARGKLNTLYGAIVKLPKKAAPTDSVLPVALFHGTRSYIEKVVNQVNASYDYGLYDCCAVMCRRLLETLIIEVYESVGRSDEIKASDGNFFMLSELQNIFVADANFNVGRNTKKGLAGFKKLGDLSAHNRRFIAQRDDVDRVRDDLRVTMEELLHLSKLI